MSRNKSVYLLLYLILFLFCVFIYNTNGETLQILEKNSSRKCSIFVCFDFLKVYDVNFERFLQGDIYQLRKSSTRRWKNPK